MRTRLQRHAQALVGSIGELVRAPAATLMAVAVIGITLAFPTGLYVAVQSLKRMSGGWDQGRQISVFLKVGLAQKQVDDLSGRIRNLPEVAAVETISAAAGFAEFKRASGFGASLDALETNPLPAVIVVRPSSEMSATSVQELAGRLKAERDVDLVQLDLLWVQRLQALLRFGERAVWLLAVLLGIAVMLIIGNTIRLAVANRRAEIEVIALVGGTPAFIRRPFVYAGTVQGALGGLAAWAIVGLALIVLGSPLSELASLYGGAWSFSGYGVATGGVLAIAGGLLGYAGSWIAVDRHLKQTLYFQ